MDIIITKGPVDDRIEIRRADGRLADTRFPKKGPVPHDAVHFIVEDVLGLRRGFWGLIAAGDDPDHIQVMAKAAGHASAKRAGIPDPAIIDLLQAERLVEAAEAALWSGGTDADGMRHLAEAGWAASHVPALALSDADLDSILTRLVALRDEWVPAPPGYQLHLRWTVA